MIQSSSSIAQKIIVVILWVISNCIISGCSHDIEKKHSVVSKVGYQKKYTKKDTSEYYLLYDKQKSSFIESPLYENYFLKDNNRFETDILCKQEPYRGKKIPMERDKIFLNGIKTSSSIFEQLIQNNKKVISYRICFSDTLPFVFKDSIDNLSFAYTIKTSTFLEMKYVNTLNFYFQKEKLNFIKNSCIDTLNILVSEDLYQLNFENTKINYLFISHAPNLDIKSLKRNELINNIVIYDNKKNSFKTIK